MAQKREREVKSVFDMFDLDGSNTVEISEVRSRSARGGSLGRFTIPAHRIRQIFVLMDELGLIKNMRSARVDWLTNALIDSGRDGSERSAASPVTARVGLIPPAPTVARVAQADLPRVCGLFQPRQRRRDWPEAQARPARGLA